jgi:hypothetical protein
VFLGWHYAIDGYLSIAVVATIWWAAGRVTGRSAHVLQKPAVTGV